MCRVAAWIGAPVPLEEVVITPTHSLLTQSQDATEAKLAVNGDGFGIAWYMPEETRPGLFRDVMPAWSDGNLPSLCRMIRSPLFLAHVRASTGAETTRANCHPFGWRNWAFMHNGQLGAFDRVRRQLEATLPDEIYLMRRGTTDSELLFLLLIAAGLDGDPVRAISKTLHQISTLRQRGDPPDRITLVLSDGKAIYALRHASDDLCPTLYHRKMPNGIVIASEPLEADEPGWTAFDKDVVWKVTADRVADIGLRDMNDAA